MEMFSMYLTYSIQESSGWCEEGTVEKLRKLLIEKIKATAADIGNQHLHVYFAWEGT